MNAKDRHSTAIDFVAPPPAEVAAGADIVVTIAVTCPKGCDLRGLPVEIAAPDGSMAAGTLARFADGSNESGELAFKAPRAPGEYRYCAAFPSHERDAVVHQRSESAFTIKTIPHATSLAVWDIPSPVVMGERFAIKVGAKSSGDIALAGAQIEICDDTGVVIGRGSLGETPWPGTSALYWTEVELTVPAQPCVVSWSAKFAATTLDLPHEGTSATFSFSAVPRPEHRLRVRVIEKETAAPIENAEVRLGAFGAATDQTGLAELSLPKGQFELFVWKAGYDAPITPVDIGADATVQVEVVALPEEDPDAAWTA